MQYWNYDKRSDGWIVCESARICPSCGGEAERVPRRLVDRLFSPGQYRFQCQSGDCQWTGNLPREGGSSMRPGFIEIEPGRQVGG